MIWFWTWYAIGLFGICRGLEKSVDPTVEAIKLFRPDLYFGAIVIIAFFGPFTLIPFKPNGDDS
jgi:hypothetical protein